MKNPARIKEGLLLRYLVTGRCSTRAALAKESGLNKMTVSNLVGDFIRAGIFEERETLSVAAPGRNPVELALCDTAPKFLGLQIHRDYCRGILCNLHLGILKEATCTLTGGSPADFPGLLADLAEGLYSPEIAGIGISSIGPVDSLGGVLLAPPNFHGIHSLPLCTLLRERFSVPVKLDSQYNCAALAEQRFGAAADLRDFLFVGISNGIGGAAVTNGQICCSSSGLGTELGHLSVDINGRQCSCGAKGCLETYCSAAVLCRDFKEETGRCLSFGMLCEDPGAREFLFDRCRILLGGLVSCVNLLNPSAVILGDEGVFLPDACLHYMETELERLRLASGFGKIRVTRPFFGQKSQLVGAAALILEEFFAGTQRLITE